MARYNKGSKRPPGPKKPPLMHFLCLPLVTEVSRPQLEESLQAFKNAVAESDMSEPSSSTPAQKDEASSNNDATLPRIHPKAFRPVGTLHCTLGVMSLKSEQLAEATKLLESLDLPSLLKTASTGEATDQPLVVDLKGLESMHAPQQTSILYAAPSDPTGRLYPFCLAVQKLFKEKGILVDDDRNLKLHATIVNTIYAKGKKQPARRAMGSQFTSSASASRSTDREVNSEDSPESRSGGHGPNANAPLKFDATRLLEMYRDHAWAQGATLEKISICEMGAKKILDDQGHVIGEQYTEVASVALHT